MIFKSLQLTEGLFAKIFKFNKQNNLIYSDKNSKGKTTLLRFLLYSLGYNIPSTQKIDFRNFETVLVIENKLIEYTIKRNKDVISVSYNGQQISFILPYELNNLLKIIYNVDNESILNNILGSFYFDQEKGWTLLNRGVVIGKNSFYIEDLIRGLSNRDCNELIEKSNEIKKQIDKYKKMYDLSEYKAQIQKDNPSLDITNKDKIIDNLSVIMNQLNNINNEINSIDNIINQNEEFIKYIEEACISVKINNNDNLIPVNRSTIYAYKDNMDFILARKNILLSEKIKLTKHLKSQKDDLQKEKTLIDTKSLIDDFDSSVLLIDIDQIAVQNIIKKLSIERNNLLNAIKDKTKINNEVIEFIYSYVKKYSKMLGIDDIVIETKDYIFTKELKGLSGAILHKLVFIFKMAYIKAIDNYTGLKLPIILDSPKGREVDQVNVDAMFNILNKDFADHQIIIASIFDDYAMKFNNTITITNLLMDKAIIKTDV